MKKETLEAILYQYSCALDIVSRVEASDFGYDVLLKKTALNKSFHRHIILKPALPYNETIARLEGVFKSIEMDIIDEKLKTDVRIGKPIYMN